MKTSNLAAGARWSRRHWLAAACRAAVAATAGLLAPLAAMALAAPPRWARAWNAAAFAARSEPEVLAALGWSGPVQDHPEVRLQVTEIAESGAVVPVQVQSGLPDTRRIALLALDNPNTLAADFSLTPLLAPRLATRIKLGGTTTVVALVQTGAGVFSARQLVKVTQGGCGG